MKVVHQMKVDGTDMVFDPMRRRKGGANKPAPAATEAHVPLRMSGGFARTRS